MIHRVVVQRRVPKNCMPTLKLLKQWANVVLQSEVKPTELTLRIVDPTEMTDLNTHYRKKSGPTNVLSFPNGDTDEGFHLLGDIVICADVVNSESIAQHKTLDAHWAHMVIHGCLHLLGHDHEEEQEAQTMEALEIDFLKTLGFPNPYNCIER